MSATSHRAARAALPKEGRRVLHVVATDGIAGAENHLFMLLPELAARGLDTHLLLLTPGPLSGRLGQRAADLVGAGVQVHARSLSRLADVRALWQVARAVWGLRPHLVHTHLVWGDLWGGIGAWLGRGRAVVSSRHRDYSFSAAERARFRRFYRLIDPFLDHQIAISHQVRRLVMEEEGVSEDRIAVVHYGLGDAPVDRAAAQAAVRAEFGIGPDVQVVGSVARLIPLKGLLDGLEAFARLRADEPARARHWIVVGEGPQEDILRARAQSLGVAADVTFAGFRDDIPQLMAAFDLLLHPTTGEGFGLVTLEAMVQQTPVALSRTGALPEIVRDGVDGWLFEPSRPDDQAAVLSRALADPDELRRMGAAGRARYLEAFTISRMVDQTLDLYAHLGAGPD